MVGDEETEKTLGFIHRAAQLKGWEVNGEIPFVRRIAQGLATNKERHGYFLCPCRDGDGERALDRDIICPCVYAGPDINEYGQCLCGLFLSSEFKASGKEPQGIPERRPEE